MEFFQLKQFKYIVEYGSMLKASDHLYVSQPAISKNLSKLEAELGCKLFNRNGKRLILTEKGKQLLTHVNAIMNEVENIRLEFNEQKLNFCFIAANFFCHLVLPDFTSMYKEINIYAKDIKNMEAFRRLKSKEADVIIGSETKHMNYENYYKDLLSDNGFQRFFLHNVQLFLSVPFSSEYAKRESITLKEIENIPLIRYNERTGMEMWLDEIISEQNIQLNLHGEFDESSVKSILPNTGYNKLITSLTIDADKRLRTERSYIRVSDEICRKELFLYYHKNNKLAHTFTQTLISNFYKYMRKNSLIHQQN